jgi:hypothetical protein
VRVFENRVLRRIYEPKREEVAGDWRRLHNEELHNIRFNKYYLSDQNKEDEMERVCSIHGKNEKCVHNFGRKTRRESASRKT